MIAPALSAIGVQLPLLAELQREMVRSDLHPLQKVKPMRVEALDARVQRKLATTFSPCFCYQPIEKLPAKSARSIALARDKIVHVQRSPGEQQLVHPVSGGGPDFAVALQVCETITLSHLALHLPDKCLPIAVVRAQLTHDLMYSPDLRGCSRIRDAR